MQTVQDRLADLQRQCRIQAGSLMATVLGDAVLPRGGRIWLGSLIGLLERLGVNERLVRTTVFRLAKDDWLLAETEGRRSNYVLSPIGRRRFDEAASHIYAAHAPPWDRRWRLVNVVGDLPARDRERLRRALVWQGFGELSAHTFIHPMADLQTCFEALKAEGLASLMHHLMPLLAANPCLDTMRMAMLWREKRTPSHYEQFNLNISYVLTDLAEEFDLPRFTAHDALGDALQTAYLFIYLAKKIARNNPLTLQELFRSGQSWRWYM